MKQTRDLMGMHITVEVIDKHVSQKDIDSVYEYFTYIDNTFSTYKETSEISKINKGLLQKKQYSSDMKTVLALCEQTRKETNGYFDILHKGIMDPSGVVKGWAIWQGGKLLQKKGFKNYYVDAGGDIQTAGKNSEGKRWRIGIRNPFNTDQIVKVLDIEDKGIATSGTYLRGQHIYNPHNKGQEITDIASITVIGPNVYEADRFATAAFAMGKEGINFIQSLQGFEGYMIDKEGIATYTDGFEKYIAVI